MFNFIKKKYRNLPKFITLMPYKSVLKKYPENIAPIPKNTRGINIVDGDSCVSSIGIFLLLYVPWKVLKNNLHE